MDFTHRVLDRDAAELVTPNIWLEESFYVPQWFMTGRVGADRHVVIMVYTDAAFDEIEHRFAVEH